MEIENSFLPDLSFQLEKSYAETNLPITASKAKLSRKILELSLRKFPKEWPLMDKVLVLLFPSFEKDVRNFHEDKGPSMNDLFQEHQLESIDKTLIVRLEEFLDDSNIDGEIKSYLERLPEYDANYEIYKYIKKYGNVTLNKISSFAVNHLDVKEEYVKNILADLIHHNFICIDINLQDLNKNTYSAKKSNKKNKLEIGLLGNISSTKENQTKIQRPSTEKIDIKEDYRDRVYSFIKKYGIVRLAHVKENVYINNLDIEKIVNNLVANGDICKNNINNEDYCSINKIKQEKNSIYSSGNTSNVDDVKLTQTSTTNIDGEISDFELMQQDTTLITEIYTFIKVNKNVVLRDIASEYNMHHLDIKGVLNGLIKDGFIYKHVFEDKIVYSTDPIHENTQKQILETKTSKGNSTPDTLKDTETHLHEVLYYYINKCGSVTIIDLANSFSMKPSNVKPILNQMVKSGLIYRIDHGNEVTYSTNIASGTRTSQDKSQKPLTEDGIGFNEPELRKYLNKKPLSVLPDHNYNAEKDDEFKHEGLPDDVETPLHNEEDADFDLDKHMSDDESD